MSVTLLEKRTSTAGKVPAITDFAGLGQLIINDYDGRLFFLKSVAGVQSVVEAATTAYAVDKAGDTMTGSLVLPGLTVNGSTSYGSTLGSKIYLWGSNYGLAINGSDFALFSGGDWSFRTGSGTGSVVASISSTGAVVADVSGASALAMGSTTTRTLAARAADVFNVKDYGATGNGVTDDTVAIMDAVRAAYANGRGGTVFFPPGNYVFQDTDAGYCATSASGLSGGTGYTTTGLTSYATDSYGTVYQVTAETGGVPSALSIVSSPLSLSSTAPFSNPMTLTGTTGTTTFTATIAWGAQSRALELAPVFANTTQEEETMPVVNLLGSGRNATTLTYKGTGNALTVIIEGFPAAPTATFHYFTLEKLRLQGPGLVGGAWQAKIGLEILFSAYCTVREVIVNGFEFGINWIDSYQALFDTCNIDGNSYGIYGGFVRQNVPAQSTFLNCEFSNNANYAAQFVDPGVLNFVGGSVAYNSASGTDSTKYGIAISNTSYPTEGGAVSASFFGVYFEGNSGLADVWILTGDIAGATAVNFVGCTFNRANNVNFATNNILLSVGATYPVQLNLIGNGFRSFNNYVPSSTRLNVAVQQLDPPNNAPYVVTDLGNNWATAIEKPTALLSQAPNPGPRAMASAWALFDGAAASSTPGTAGLTSAFNIFQLSRSGAGIYYVAFNQPMTDTNYTVTGCANNSTTPFAAGTVAAISKSKTGVEILTSNTAGTWTDFDTISVTIMGSGEIAG